MSCKFCQKEWCWHCQSCGEKVTSLDGEQRCDDCHAKSLDGHFACTECGKHYHSSMTGAELRPGLCFNCNFWVEKVEWSQDPEDALFCVRVNGSHYHVGVVCPPGFGGYGGNQFTILTKDGHLFATRNLWHQGDIPIHFRERLPDNATFVSISDDGNLIVPHDRDLEIRF